MGSTFLVFEASRSFTVSERLPQKARIRRGVRTILAALAVLAVLGVAGLLVGRQIWAAYHFHAAGLAMARRDFDQAGAHLAKCLEVWPNSAEAHFLMARAARRAGKYDEAETHLHRARELHWAAEALDAEHAMLKAQRAESGEQRDVQPLLLHWIEQGHPDSVLMLEALVQGYMKTYFLPAAVQCLEMWLERQPDDPQALLWRGDAWERLHRYEDALVDYQRVVDLAPDRDDARRKLAEGLLQAHRAREAEPHFESLHERHPGDAAVLLGLARCHLEMGQTDQARRLLDELLAAQPGDGLALGERGKLELDAGRPDEAERWLRKAVTVVPYERTLVYCYVRALDQQGKQEEAALWTARLDRIDDDLKRISEVMRTIHAVPNDPAPRHEAGVILLRNGQEQEGLRWLANALQQDPNYRPTLEFLAEYFESHGQPEKAAQHRRRAGQGR
jgi:tetratricopeptide (TPR) repeat protein